MGKQLRVEAHTDSSFGLFETNLTYPTKPKPGRIRILSIGVAKYPYLDDGAQLNFTNNDARNLVRQLRRSLPEQYDDIESKVLLDADRPTKSNIEDALDWLEESNAEDTTIVFVASHGLTDPDGNFYIAPQDTQDHDISLDGGAVVNPNSLVSWRRFFESFQRTLGKRLMIVDACNGRGIEGNLDIRSVLKRSANSSIAFLSASKADELSRELPSIEMGIFLSLIHI